MLGRVPKTPWGGVVSCGLRSHISPIFSVFHLPPIFWKKFWLPPPITKVLGHPPFWKSYTPQKYQEKEEKTGYFCPQCSHFFRKGFDLPPFRVSVHILCNMITYISLPKKFPSSSLPPHFLGHPSPTLTFFGSSIFSPPKKQKKTCWSKPPSPQKNISPHFWHYIQMLGKVPKKNSEVIHLHPAYIFEKVLTPPLKKSFAPPHFLKKL